MDLRIIWFSIIAFLFTGFFFLEGIDFGVGVLINLLGKNNTERRIIINTIGPFWDGNEVWLVTAGASIFAAFPQWYATMFSGFYLALLIILVALILRGVYFEFRSKKEGEVWKRNWDIIMFISNLLLSILWGTALANLIKGVPIDKSMNYTGGFFDLISLYTLFAGLTTLIVFAYNGSIYLSFRTTGIVEKRSKKTAKKLAPFSAIAVLVLITLTFMQTDLYNSRLALISSLISFILVFLSWYLVIKEKSFVAMLVNGLTIALGVASLFLGLFPRVIVSSIKPEYALTIYNASSGPYSLSIMTKVAITFLPIVIAYQTWSYWVFRKRVSTDDLEY